MTALNSAGPRLTRGAAFQALIAAVVVLLGGCSAANDPPSGAQSTSGAATPSQPAHPIPTGPGPAALSVILETRLFVESVGVQFPALSTRTGRLASTHLVHEEFLGGLLNWSPSPEPGVAQRVPARRVAAERAVGASESRLAATLADLALTAADGALARALASISAGTSQISTSAGWKTEPAPMATLPESPALSAVETLAVQDVLGREHASLWWYGVLGGRTSPVEQPGLIPTLTTGYDAHRRQRDELTALMFDQGVTPVASEPTYSIDWNLRARRRNAKEVHRIEQESAAAYSWLVAETTGDLRTWAVTALRNAAIRDLVVQGTPENFPGADEIADR